MNGKSLTISQKNVPILEDQVREENGEFINFLSIILCIVWHVAMSFYCFYQFFKTNTKKVSQEVKIKLTIWKMALDCLLIVCFFFAKMCHWFCYLWGWKYCSSYCLMSTWLAWISGSFRESPTGEMTLDVSVFPHKTHRALGGLKSPRLHISRSWGDEIWWIFLLLLILTLKIVKFQRQGKDLEKVKQRLIEIANHVDKVSSFAAN